MKLVRIQTPNLRVSVQPPWTQTGKFAQPVRDTLFTVHCVENALADQRHQDRRRVALRARLRPGRSSIYYVDDGDNTLKMLH